MCFLCSLNTSVPLVHAAEADRGGEAGGRSSMGKPTLSTGQAVGQLAEAAWPSRDVPVTYAFRSSGGEAAFKRFSPEQIAAAEIALQLWSDVANLRLERVGGGLSGDGAYSNDASILLSGLTKSQNYAYAYLPGDRAAGSRDGDVYLNVAYPSLNDMRPGTYGFLTMVHETGHALGLTHPASYNAASGGTFNYAAHAEYAEDTRQFTLMSYFGAGESGADHRESEASTPLLHDIAAIQSLYGANTGTRSGDTVYGFNATAERAVLSLDGEGRPPVFAIWDGGGTDTLDLSGYGAGQRIDLAPNSFSDAGGLTRNIAIADRAVIENAVGGRGDDRITGNDAANSLAGQGGDDTLLGLSGDDLLSGQDGRDALEGGDGADTLLGGSGDDRLAGGAGSDRLDGGEGADRLTGGGGADTLTGRSGRDVFVFEARGEVDLVTDFSGDDVVAFEGPLSGRDGGRLTWREASQILAFDPDGDGPDGAFDIARLDVEEGFSDANVSGPRNFGFVVERAEGRESRGGDRGDDLNGGDGADRITGGGGDDALTGHGGNDDIHGEDGDDRLQGGAGADRLSGGHGRDRLDGGEGRDRLNGGSGEDELRGDAGMDELNGEDGGDRLDGGDGADRLSGGSCEDELRGGGGDDELRGDGGHDALHGEAGDDWLEGGDGEDRLSGGDGEDELRGDGGHDALAGDKGVDALFGGSGDDRLSGGEGDDRLFGEEGDDRLEGDSGADRLTGGRGDDTLLGGDGRDVFVFTGAFDRDVVVDFRGEDVIEMERRGFSDVTGLLARASQSGADTILSHDGGEIVLQNVQRSSLVADDFRFV